MRTLGLPQCEEPLLDRAPQTAFRFQAKRPSLKWLNLRCLLSSPIEEKRIFGDRILRHSLKWKRSPITTRVMGKSSLPETLPGTILSPHQVDPLLILLPSLAFQGFRQTERASLRPRPTSGRPWSSCWPVQGAIAGTSRRSWSPGGQRLHYCPETIRRVPTIDQSDVDFVYGDDIQLQLIGTTSTSDGSSEWNQHWGKKFFLQAVRTRSRSLRGENGDWRGSRGSSPRFVEGWGEGRGSPLSLESRRRELTRRRNPSPLQERRRPMAPFSPDYPGPILFLDAPLTQPGQMQTVFKIHKIYLCLIFTSIEECATPVPSILEECPSPPSYIFTASPVRRQDSLHRSASCILDEEESGPGEVIFTFRHPSRPPGSKYWQLF